jgi:dihydrofolate reductase
MNRRESQESMRRVRYQVACSLDGYIAGPKGEFDWIVDEPAFDFDALYAQFDTLVMGRATYEVVRDLPGAIRGQRVIVASKSVDPGSIPGVEVVGDDLLAKLDQLKAEPGRDIWLYGGGVLFRFLLEHNVVDTIELAIIPILLGEGIPFLPSSAVRRRLKLEKTQVYPSGIVLLEYSVDKQNGNEATDH